MPSFDKAFLELYDNVEDDFSGNLFKEEIDKALHTEAEAKTRMKELEKLGKSNPTYKDAVDNYRKFRKERRVWEAAYTADRASGITGRAVAAGLVGVKPAFHTNNSIQFLDTATGQLGISKTVPQALKLPKTFAKYLKAQGTKIFDDPQVALDVIKLINESPQAFATDLMANAKTAEEVGLARFMDSYDDSVGARWRVEEGVSKREGYKNLVMDIRTKSGTHRREAMVNLVAKLSADASTGITAMMPMSYAIAGYGAYKIGWSYAKGIGERFAFKAKSSLHAAKTLNSVMKELGTDSGVIGLGANERYELARLFLDAKVSTDGFDTARFHRFQDYYATSIADNVNFRYGKLNRMKYQKKLASKGEFLGLFATFTSFPIRNRKNYIATVKSMAEGDYRPILRTLAMSMMAVYWHHATANQKTIKDSLIGKFGDTRAKRTPMSEFSNMVIPAILNQVGIKLRTKKYNRERKVESLLSVGGTFPATTMNTMIDALTLDTKSLERKFVQLPNKEAKAAKRLYQRLMKDFEKIAPSLKAEETFKAYQELNRVNETKLDGDIDLGGDVGLGGDIELDGGTE